MNLRKLLFAGTRGNAVSTDAGLLILRLVAGLALALGHGLGKFPPSPRFIAGVGELGFPLAPLFAWAAAVAELFGGILLAIGLLVRPASLLILLTMATAVLLAHADDPFRVKELALLYGTVALLYLLAGGGRYSLDARLGGARK